MSNSHKEVENQILEAGKKLIDPPSSVDELLSLLDNLFTCLMDVEQSPPVSMQNALSPLMKALVSGKILKHSDIDVKVAVAACISEITRITAPEAPYDDDEMKEVFKLLVSSFEDLADNSSCSYSKRLSILEAASKVRSCIVMLDLECDALIIEMFQHFLKAIREHHPGDVFSYMENIMTLVLEESEDIPPEMLSPILHYVKKDAEVSQLSRRLAEQVLGNCASKLKTYLNEAVKSSGAPLDMYSDIVASICEGTFSALQQDQIVLHEKEDSQDHLTRDTEVEGKQKAAEISTPEQTDAPKDESGKSGVSNDSSDSTKKQDITSGKDEQQQLDNPSNTDVDNTSELKLDVEHQTKEKEKQSSSVEEADSSTNSDIKEETELVAVLESKDVLLTSPPDDSSGKAATSSKNEKKTSVQALPAKTSADETANVSSPSRGEDVLEQSEPKKTVNQKKKESSTKEFKPSATSATEESSEEPNTSEAEVPKKSGKKVASSSKGKPTVPPSKKSKSDTKVAKQSEKKAVGNDNAQESKKPTEEKEKSGRGKSMDEESLHTSSGDNKKPAVSSEKSAIKSKREAKQPVEENPNTDTKGKQRVNKRKASDIENHDGSLLGSRIRVWWPMDQAYYKGVISLYVSGKKRHVVCYDDGDQELLNLKKERWYFEDEPESSAEKGGGASSSKSKATPASKSGKKSHKTENRPKDTKKANKEEEEISEESGEEEVTPKPVGKSGSSKSKKNTSSNTSKSGKPKDQGVSGTSKASSKKKEEPSKTTTASKSKSGPAKSAQPKSKTGKGKAKTGSASTPASKAKESDVESESEETPKASETETKGKPIKSQGSQAKSSSKKRKR